MEKQLHVIVAPGAWQRGGVRYRRHRLARFLADKPDTAGVIWVFPLGATPRRPRSYVDCLCRIRGYPAEASPGVLEFGVADILPGQATRFNRCLTRRPLQQLLVYLQRWSSFKKVLWYTCPAYPQLISFIDWDLVVYDCSDKWSSPWGGGLNPWSARWIEQSEEQVLKNSAVVFASADYLGESVQQKVGRSAVVIENGVDYKAFCGGATGCGSISGEITGGNHRSGRRLGLITWIVMPCRRWRKFVHGSKVICRCALCGAVVWEALKPGTLARGRPGQT